MRKQLKHINRDSARILHTLFTHANNAGGSTRIDNTNNTFMPVSLEILPAIGPFQRISVAHYYEQNGDLMADPEMVFAFHKEVPILVFPEYFRQDGIFGRETELMHYDNGRSITRFMPRAQLEAARFAGGLWLPNIKRQQRLRIGQLITA